MQLWRLDAEHSDDDNVASLTHFFVERAGAIASQQQLEREGFYTDLYRVWLRIPAHLVKTLCDRDWPNINEEALVDLARDPVAKAAADLQRMVARKGVS
jgi:hypothetical protein